MDTLDKSIQSLGRAHREILAMYIFGSQASGKIGPLSDLDVAVLLDERQLPRRKRFNFQLDLAGETMHTVKRSDLDFVVLNEASPLLAYEVVRSGRLIYERQHDARVTFEVHAVQRYLDLEPFYRVSRSYLKKQLLSSRSRGQS